MAISDRTLTLEEFLALPPGEPSFEFDDGVVTQKMSPKADHGRLQFKIAEVFNRIGEPAGIGLAFTETRFSVGKWAPVPDVVFYTRERLPVESGGFGDFRVAPDIAVEIVSPGQRLNPLIRKCLRYARIGVRVTLLVDPEDRSVLDFRPGVQMRALQGSDRIELDEILPGFELTVDELFRLIVPPWIKQEGSPEG
jgi:Uma2 family endonuclease